jgi:hypothetical protein
MGAASGEVKPQHVVTGRVERASPERRDLPGRYDRVGVLQEFRLHSGGTQERRRVGAEHFEAADQGLEGPDREMDESGPP